MRNSLLVCLVTLFTMFVGEVSGYAVESGPRSRSRSVAPFDRILIVILENERAENVLAQPFFKKLADDGAYMRNFFATVHPSYPNYIAMTSGSTWGILSNDQVTIDKTSIVDLLEAKGRSWKLYAENYPGNCYLKSSAPGAYSRKHVPMLSYKRVQQDPALCAKVVNANELKIDVEKGQLPDFSLYIPNDKNNGHDTGVAYAAKAMEATFGPLLNDPRFTKGLLFIMTYDEDNYMGGNRVYTTLWGDSVKRGMRSEMRYTHYSLLRTVEDAFELGTLGRNDQEATRINDVWR